MTEDKLLEFASARAALLNLSSAWGSDEDGVLLIQLISRIEALTAEVARLREALKELDWCAPEKASDLLRAALAARGLTITETKE
jgi:hypothetical protein